MISNKSLKTSLICLMLVNIGIGLFAWSITDTYFGNRINTVDPRAFAMGGATAYNELKPFAISSNPANLAIMNRLFGVQGTAGITRNEDNRSIPLYNSFDAYIDDAVISSNINEYYDYSAVGFGLYKFGNIQAGLGAYYKPYASYDGKYLEEIRNNRGTDNDTYPEKIAINKIDNEGTLGQYAGVFAVGMSLGDHRSINLGFDYSVLNGDISQMKSIRWTQWSEDQVGPNVLPDSTYTNEFTLDGGQMKLGLSVQVNERLGIAASYSMKSDLDKEGTSIENQEAWMNHAAVNEVTDYSETYTIPSELRLGISYQPRNVVRTWLNMDVERVQWSDLSEIYDDVYNIYVGVEHHIRNRIPFRIGFQAVNNYRLEHEMQVVNQVPVHLTLAKKTLTPMISAGSSIALAEGLSLDLGFGFAWREFESLDMFRDSYYNDKIYTGSNTYALWPNSYITLTDRGWDNPDTVSENFITLMSGLSFVW